MPAGTDPITKEAWDILRDTEDFAADKAIKFMQKMAAYCTRNSDNPTSGDGTGKAKIVAELNRLRADNAAAVGDVYDDAYSIATTQGVQGNATPLANLD